MIFAGVPLLVCVGLAWFCVRACVRTMSLAMLRYLFGHDENLCESLERSWAANVYAGSLIFEIGSQAQHSALHLLRRYSSSNFGQWSLISVVASFASNHSRTNLSLGTTIQTRILHVKSSYLVWKLERGALGSTGYLDWQPVPCSIPVQRVSYATAHFIDKLSSSRTSWRFRPNVPNDQTSWFLMRIPLVRYC